MNKIFFFIALPVFFGHAQNVELTPVAKLDKALHETSGLVVAGGKIWSLNDSGDDPVLYGFDPSGKISDIIYVSGRNADWEDLAKDADGNIYIGDIGNNYNKRHNLRIYVIPPPEKLPEKIAKPAEINFSYSDQKFFPPDKKEMNFDCAAMLCHNHNLYLFSKNRTEPFDGICKMYRLPAKPGVHVAQLIDSVYLPAETMLTGWITAADISPDGKKMILMGHDKMYVFTCFEGDDFFSGKMTTVKFLFTQKEALSFINDEEVYITDEVAMRLVGGNLYHLNLKNVKLPKCE